MGPATIEILKKSYNYNNNTRTIADFKIIYKSPIFFGKIKIDANLVIFHELLLFSRKFSVCDEYLDLKCD